MLSYEEITVKNVTVILFEVKVCVQHKARSGKDLYMIRMTYTLYSLHSIKPGIVLKQKSVEWWRW